MRTGRAPDGSLAFTRYGAKRAIKTACYAAAAVVGTPSEPWRSRKADGDLRVLMYHKVSREPGNTIAVTPEQFRRQMTFLVGHYAVVTPRLVLEAVTTGALLPPRAVLVTFDDGYRDNLEHAYPILEDLGLEAVIFPATGFLGGRRRLPHDERLSMENPLLTWEQLGQMRTVFTVGSHGVSHQVLTRLPFDEAVAEIVESKAQIEDRYGSRVEFFSYPKGSTGDYNLRLEEAVAEAGYVCSFTTIPGGNSACDVRSGTWLRRYNGEPLPDRLFAKVLAGSCDVIRVKDSAWGRALKARFNDVLGTTTG